MLWWTLRLPARPALRLALVVSLVVYGVLAAVAVVDRGRRVALEAGGQELAGPPAPVAGGRATAVPGTVRVPPVTGPVRLRLASAEAGSAWYLQAAAVAEALRRGLPAGSAVEVLPFAGAVANPDQVAGGRAELALALDATARRAYSGGAPYGRPRERLRGLAGGLGRVYAVVAVAGPAGTAGEWMARAALAAYGAGYQDLEDWGGQVTHAPDQVVAGLLRDGRVDLWIHVAPAGDPTLVELIGGGGFRLLPLGQRAVRQVAAATGFEPAQLPAGAYGGRSGPLPTVTAHTVLLADELLPFSVAYALTRALADAWDRVAAAAGGAPVGPDGAWRQAVLGVPLHSGAEAYYRERGWFRPEYPDVISEEP